MKNQAQFHPTKYLVHLLQLITEKGGLIFENTTAVNIETGEQPVVLTREGPRITANHVLACSHFPFYEGARALFYKDACGSIICPCRQGKKEISRWNVYKC